MPRLRSALILPVLAVAGCATGPGLQSRMAAYIGAPEAKLVQEMGVPDKQIAVNGVQYLAYDRVRQQVLANSFAMGGFGPFWGPYYGGFYAPLPQNVQVWSCEITFAVQDGKVSGFTLKGNDCD